MKAPNEKNTQNLVSGKNSKKVEVYHSKKLIGKFKKVKNISKGNSGFRMGGNIINLKISM